ncbi:cytochrome P450 [Biscogniauxia marginata]|nr:cytochrome P450 [Biscogniauxia marginata]
MAHLLFFSGCAAVALLVFWLFSARPPVTKEALSHIPELRFKENDAPERYLSDSRSLLFRGYEKYLRHGTPFQMRNPVGELGPQLLLPMKYLDEVKAAPASVLSFTEFSEKAFLLRYSDAPYQTEASAQVIRIDLNKNLGALADGIYTEVEAALDSRISSEEWTKIGAYDLVSSVVSRATALVLVGPELCRNPEWLQIALTTTFAVFGAANAIRDNFTPRWRWLSRWKSDAPKQLREIRAKATKLLRPLYNERLSSIKKGRTSSFKDTMNWLLRLDSAEKSMARIADQQLFLTLASVHTTSATLTTALFDMLSHSEYHEELAEEMRQAIAERDGPWTLQHVSKMRKLDSFMKESQRVHPIGFITAQRIAVRPYTFKDGLYIPAGTVMQFPADAVHQDAANYPEPDKFDGYRFLRLRETVDPNRFHFSSVSDTSLNFGAGFHSCPGRFLSALVIKFVLMLLWTKYEVKFPDGEGPKFMAHDFTLGPAPGVNVMVRKKKL